MAPGGYYHSPYRLRRVPTCTDTTADATCENVTTVTIAPRDWSDRYITVSEDTEPAPHKKEKEEDEPVDPPKPYNFRLPKVKPLISQTFQRPIQKQFTSFHAILVSRNRDFARN